METQRTCNERIQEHLDSRLESLLPDLDDLAGIKTAAIDWGFDLDDREEDEMDDDYADRIRDDVAEKVRECGQEMPAGIDFETVVTVTIGGGGPADWFEFCFDRHGDLTRGVYVFQDWGDSARRNLDDKTAEALVELWGIDPASLGDNCR
jgi:hypothetical protein